MSSKINTNGNAETMEAVCNAFNPPDHSNTEAAADWINPQISLILSGGLNIPFVVCIPMTNVAESAEVIKKIAIRIIPTIVKIVGNGNSPNVANNAISV